VSVYCTKAHRGIYQFDFQIKGHRFHGSTGCTSRREAEKVEAVEREKARAVIKAMSRSRTSLAIDDVADRLWTAEAQHAAAPGATMTNLARLIEYFGKTTLLTEIDHAKAVKLVAWRRGQRVKRRGKVKEDAPLISNGTVNRSTTAVLRRLFMFAKDEGARFDHEPKWTELMLPEPEERVREVQEHEADALDDAMREDYKPFFEFARATGLRFKECVTLRWSEVNFGTRQIIRIGKRKQRIVLPITETIREIIFPLQGQHGEFVFTYVSEVTNKRLGRVKGERYPLSFTGTKSVWQRLRANAGVNDLRFHDFRHDFGSKLLRETGNLKLVQKAMNHRDIKSTLRYAHVLDDEIADAIERVAKARAKPRAAIRKVV
jgi:integrase